MNTEAVDERELLIRKMERERRIQDAMFSSITDFAYLFDLEGRFLTVNRPLLDLWGLTLEEAVGKNFFDLKYPDDLASRLQRQIQQVILTRSQVVDETEYVSPAGAVGYYEYIFSPVFGADGGVEAVAGTTRVITERKKAEAALRQSEEQYRAILEALDEGVSLHDAKGRMVTANASAERVLGLRADEILGRDSFDERWQGVKKDGSAMTGDEHPPQVAITTGRAVRNVVMGVNRRDGTRVWVSVNAVPLKDQEGNVTGAVTSFFDVTDRKGAEEERERSLRNEQAARAEADAANLAKDRFLAVLSHELRTPLSPVVMTVPAIENDPALPAKFRDQMGMIRRNIDLEVKLIDDLLDLSRVTSGKLRLEVQEVGMHELLRHVLEISGGELMAKKLLVRSQFDAVNDCVAGDPARLQQVFWNLLRNAAKFTPEGGEVAIRTWNDAEAGGEGRLMIEVRDNGIGISEAALPGIFDAFDQGDTRVTRQFGGLGLGLAISKAVVDMHGGGISAQSDGEGRGTTFTVWLETSVAERRKQEVVAEGGSMEAQKKKARVLLVEDHQDTARVLALLLRGMGYEVETAGSVAEGAEMAKKGFDLMLSDLGLPDGNGYELMEKVRGLGIKGIALSGYGMEDDMKRSREAGFLDHVIKPINVERLEVVMNAVLGGE